MLGRVAAIRWRSGHYPVEMQQMGLLEDDLGEMEVARRVSHRILRRWQHAMNPEPHAATVNIKTVFYRRCCEAGLRTPEVYAEGLPEKALLAGLPERFLAKPVLGSGGKGVFAYTREGVGFVDWRGDYREARTVVDQLTAACPSRPFVFQEWLRVHPHLAALSGLAVPTVRSVTLLEASGPRLLFAYLRVPAPGKLADNYGDGLSGEAALELDPASGQPLQFAYPHPSGYGMAFSSLLPRHPPIAVDSLEMADWEAMRALSLQLASTFPGARCLGWDIALSDTGPVVLEGNTHWGYGFFPQSLRVTVEAMRAHPIRSGK